MKKLPNKPSKLLALALSDLEKAEKSKFYEIDMDGWHTPNIDKQSTCSVCLAGSVIAFSLKTPRVMEKSPNHFLEFEGRLGEVIYKQLTAINQLREGYVADALEKLGIDVSDAKVKVMDREITEYGIDKREFKKQMRELISDLALVGL
jgi:hypothetical protein